MQVGVIGIGFIGGVHIEALRRNPGLNVAALASSSLERARKHASHLSVEKAYGDWRELVEDPSIDVIHVASPNNQHYEQVKAALEAGKHVMAEKPLTTTVPEAAELLELARSKGVVHGVNFNIRFYPMMLDLKARIAAGELGEIHTVQGSYQQDWLLYPTDYNWRLVSAVAGASRAVADIGSHWMDLAETVSGERIAEVCADLNTIFPVRKRPRHEVETFSGKTLAPEDYEDVAIDTEDYASVLLRYEGRTRGVLTVSQCCAGRKNRLYLEIHGTRKSAAWDSERCNELWIGERDTANHLVLRDPALLAPEAAPFADFPGGHNEGFPDTFKQLYKAFYADVRAGRPSENPPYATFADGLRELQLTEAILASNQAAAWTKVGS